MAVIHDEWPEAILIDEPSPSPPMPLMILLERAFYTRLTDDTGVRQPATLASPPLPPCHYADVVLTC